MTLFTWFLEKIKTIPMLKSSTEVDSDVPDKVFTIINVCNNSIALIVDD